MAEFDNGLPNNDSNSGDYGVSTILLNRDVINKESGNDVKIAVYDVGVEQKTKEFNISAVAVDNTATGRNSLYYFL